MTSTNADTPEAFAERERRKRVIDLARAIFIRHYPVTFGECFVAAATFDEAAERYRKGGKL